VHQMGPVCRAFRRLLFQHFLEDLLLSAYLCDGFLRLYFRIRLQSIDARLERGQGCLYFFEAYLRPI
jgi:hypothetical protein